MEGKPPAQNKRKTSANFPSEPQVWFVKTKHENLQHLRQSTCQRGKQETLHSFNFEDESYMYNHIANQNYQKYQNMVS